MTAVFKNRKLHVKKIYPPDLVEHVVDRRWVGLVYNNNIIIAGFYDDVSC